MRIDYLIDGELPSKSNNRRLVHFRGMARIIKSQPALDFTKKFCMTYGRSIPLFKKEDKLFLSVALQVNHMRRDVDIALLMDALQAARQIHNDRQIWKIEALRVLNRKAQPKITAYLEVME